MFQYSLYYVFCLYILHFKCFVCSQTITSVPITDPADTSGNIDIPPRASTTTADPGVTTTTLPSTNETNTIPDTPISGGENTTINETISNDNTTEVPSTLPGGEGSTNATLAPEVVGNNTEDNSTENAVLIYVNEASFHGNMSGWNFNGMWGKYNLKAEPQRIGFTLPDIPTSKDKEILLTMDTSGPFLEKEFPPLVNGSFSLTSYVNCSQNITIEAEASNKYRTEKLFTVTELELENVNLHWWTSTYAIETQTSPFKVKLIYKSSDSNCAWALDVITVRGIETNETEEVAPPEIPVIPVPVVPEFNVTNTTTVAPIDQNSTVNATEPETNVSTTTLPTTTTNATNEEITPVPLPLTTQEPETTTDSRLPESVAQMAQIASTMWDAFYVFLALFCACIIALIVLIVLQRRSRDEPSPPTVEAYSPRASSYQIEKARDNTAYQTDAV